MRFAFEQRFSAPPDLVAAAYADPGLYETFERLPKMEVLEVLDHRRTGSTVHLRVRSRFAAELPSAARRILDPAKLTWVEESTHDLDGLTVSFRLLPDHYGDRMQASGSYRFDARPEGSIRRTQGDVKVSYPLVGGTVERALVAGLGEHLQHEVPVVEQWLAER